MARLKRDLVGVTLKVANAASIGQLTCAECATMVQAIRLFNIDEWAKNLDISVGALAAIAGVPRADRKSVATRLGRNGWLKSSKRGVSLGQQFADLTPLTAADIEAINKSMNQSLVSNLGGDGKPAPSVTDEVRGLLKTQGLTANDEQIVGAIQIANSRGVSQVAAYAVGIIKKQTAKAAKAAKGGAVGTADNKGADKAVVQTLDPTTGDCIT